jgi:hypothetical protein
VRKIDGTAWKTVTPCRSTPLDSSARPSPSSANGTTAAPFSNAPNWVDTVPLKLGFCTRLRQSPGASMSVFV